MRQTASKTSRSAKREQKGPSLFSPLASHLSPLFLALLACVGGCRQSQDNQAAEPALRGVAIVHPERKTIRREVAQPGSIQAFERTPIVARIPGYVLKWNADIGDAIHQGEVLAKLWVPEMEAELQLKEEQVQQAIKSLAMSQAQLVTAEAHVKQAEAGLGRAQATHDYWKGQSENFARLVAQKTLDKQSQADAQNQFHSAAAALAEARAAVESANALRKEREAARDKAQVDIKAAAAEKKRQADLVAYATLTAPYDGIVSQRSVNTRQFVQPATGPKADVLYVVEKTDKVRIFISVPETEADWVRIGTPATVLVQALRGQEFRGEVTRTAWSLNQVTRTLLTEIDLENPEVPKEGRRLRPGMYVYATIQTTSPPVLTLPASAVATEGDVNVGYRTFCWIVENGAERRVRRAQIEIGARNDQLAEVLKKRAVAKDGAEPEWEAFTGAEEVVARELSGLKDGQRVEAIRARK